MRILSEAYSDESKQDFYSFVRSLDALKASMTGDNKTGDPVSGFPRSRRFSTEDNIKAGVCNILAGTGFFMPESPQFCVSSSSTECGCDVQFRYYPGSVKA